MDVTASRPTTTSTESPRANRLRIRWAAIGAAVAVTLGAGTIATVDAVQTSGERLTYVASEPCRLMNTRPGPNQVGPRTTPLPGGSPITVQARGTQGNCTPTQLPNDAKALQLNVTPVNATASTDITIWPSGPIPQASSVNPRPGPPVPNAVVATLAADGSFQMQNKFGTIDMVIDVVGYFVDHNHDDRYYTKAQVDAAIAAGGGGGSAATPSVASAQGDQTLSVTSPAIAVIGSPFAIEVRSVTLTAPSAGTVVVNASLSAEHADASNATFDAYCGITTLTDVDSTARLDFELDDDDETVVALTRAFDVAPGGFTVDLMCGTDGPLNQTRTMTVTDSSLVATFIPD